MEVEVRRGKEKLAGVWQCLPTNLSSIWVGLALVITCPCRFVVGAHLAGILWFTN